MIKRTSINNPYRNTAFNNISQESNWEKELIKDGIEAGKEAEFALFKIIIILISIAIGMVIYFFKF